MPPDNKIPAVMCDYCVNTFPLCKPKAVTFLNSDERPENVIGCSDFKQRPESFRCVKAREASDAADAYRYAFQARRIFHV